MLLEKFIKSIYTLPNDAKYLTVLDLVPIYFEFDKYQDNLKMFLNNIIENNIELDSTEKIIIENETSPFRYLIFLIRHNHFINYYLELNLILNGINSSITPNVIKHNKKLVKQIYKNIDNIGKIHILIISVYEKIISGNYPMSEKYDLKKFYSRELLRRFIQTLDFKVPSEFNKYLSEKTIMRLKKIYQTVIDTSIQTKTYIQKLLDSNIFDSNPSKHGLSNFDQEFYIFNLKYMCGLNLNSGSDIEYLYNWANQYLKYNINNTKKIIQKIYPHIKTTAYDYKDLLQMINADENFKFNSEEELKNAYISKINEQYNFVVDNNIPLTNKCEFTTFNNPNSTSGFYLNNCFFLNTNNWTNVKKFEVRALTMHESYPGHHLQIDLSTHNNKNNYLTTLYQEMFCTYIEGWALFAEKIHSDIDLSSDFGQSDSDLLRILRIIADIDIHYWGKSPEEVINKMDDYLALDRLTIISEVYRYLTLPGQAISYKIGESIFMGIYYKLKNESKTEIKINDPIMIEYYKNILLQGEVTAEELLKRHSMSFFYKT